MFLARSNEYDRSVNTFSPEGRLFQVEYAIRCTKRGGVAVGLKTKEGVVLAADRGYTTRLVVPRSIEKIMEIDEHIGCAVSGVVPDGRTLVEHARVETQNHRLSYGEPMTVESTTQALADLALQFGESEKMEKSRPFGVALLIGGHDENGPSLYYTDPSGLFCQCNAKAIGSQSEGADKYLQQHYNEDLTLNEAETIVISAMRESRVQTVSFIVLSYFPVFFSSQEVSSLEETGFSCLLTMAFTIKIYSHSPVKCAQNWGCIIYNQKYWKWKSGCMKSEIGITSGAHNLVSDYDEWVMKGVNFRIMRLKR